MAGVMVDRCATGIPGFDNICQGGLVRNSSNVLIGGPGSGKTTFMLQFLWNGATKYNENGLYCSFEPDILETLKDGMSYGWDFTKLNEQDRVKFLKFSPQTSVQELTTELTGLIAKYDVKRICFDPISVLAMAQENDGKIREMIFDLVSLLKRLKVTSVLADETNDEEDKERGEYFDKTEIIKFLADSVTILSEEKKGNTGDRALKVSKMRRTLHFRNWAGMMIGSNGLALSQ
jgi:circadian clock protein KaiC